LATADRIFPISLENALIDRERAEAVAIKQLALDDDQRSQLLIRERL
jgi:hypothetical protein